MAMPELALREIVGKTIKAVVCDANTFYESKRRFFLVFTDGSYLEFFGNDVHCAEGINWGGGDGEWYSKRFSIPAKVIGNLSP
jgi:hypothetical protein